jgi:hypothetical protein
MNSLPELFASLSGKEQRVMVTCIVIHTNKKEFLSLFLFAAPTAAHCILEYVINQAIAEKVTKTGISAEEAKLKIEAGLKDYYHHGKYTSLSREGNLRAYFRSRLFNSASIEKKFPSIGLGSHEEDINEKAHEAFNKTEAKRPIRKWFGLFKAAHYNAAKSWEREFSLNLK